VLPLFKRVKIVLQWLSGQYIAGRKGMTGSAKDLDVKTAFRKKFLLVGV
jgi:hypothetical protein